MKLKVKRENVINIIMCLLYILVVFTLVWSACVNETLNEQIKKDKELLISEKQKNEEFTKQLEDLNKKIDELSDQIPK